MSDMKAVAKEIDEKRWKYLDKLALDAWANGTKIIAVEWEQNEIFDFTGTIAEGGKAPDKIFQYDFGEIEVREQSKE